MLGFYPPTEGKVCIGGQSLQDLSFKQWRRHCGVVMQEGFIFNDTIANNIAPEDDTVDKKKLLYAVDMANIRSFIETLPLKYNTRIGNTGQGVSQGQKQRILIARAIYATPITSSLTKPPMRWIRTMRKQSSGIWTSFSKTVQ